MSTTNQAIKVEAKSLIFLYCVFALINVPQLASIMDAKAYRLFDWYVNDMSYAIRIIILAIPVIFKVDFNNEVRLFERFLFLGLVITNLITISNDYIDLSDKIDDIILYPRLLVILYLLILTYPKRELKYD